MNTFVIQWLFLGNIGEVLISCRQQVNDAVNILSLFRL